MPTIQGIVTDQNAQPLGAVTVRIVQGITYNVTLSTDIAGNFSHVVPSSAPVTTISFNKPAYSFKPDTINFYMLMGDVVKTANSQGFSLTISGSATYANGAGIADALIQVVSGGASMPIVRTAGDGSYVVGGLPGYVATSIYITKDGFTFEPASYNWSANAFTANKIFNTFGNSVAISGKIVRNDNSPVSGIDVQLYQNQSFIKKSTTDASGNYVIPGVAPQINTAVYPKNSGYTFVPTYASWTANDFNTDETANFVGYSCTVSGYIRKPDLSGLASTQVIATQGSSVSSVYSDQNGFYTITLPGKLATTLSVSKTACTFSPVSKSWSANDFVGTKTQSFTSTCVGLLVLSGQINGTNPSDIKVDLLQNNTLRNSTTANSTGYYSFTDLDSGNYTVRPSRSGCTFLPTQLNVQLLSSVNNVNFAATCTTSPVAIISATPLYGSAPLTVQFDSTGSSDPNGQSLTYNWNFGDGTSSTEASVDYTYDTNGQYAVTLTVSAGGQTGTAQVSILVGMPLRDTIVFKSGPLRGQCFPLLPDSLGENATGHYLQFQVPLNYQLSQNFNSSDDQYDIQYFLTDLEDMGVIGEFDPPEDSTGSNLAMRDRTIADHFLSLSPHLYNSVPVPVANASIAVAKNYSNAADDGELVYVVYQALEAGRWRVYLRQIRISEYKKPDPPDFESVIKGFDVAEPVLISEETGDCTNPVVKVDYNNDIFVAYESTDTAGLQQVVLKGTEIPHSFLPEGSNPSRDPDTALNYFLEPADFIYARNITTDGLNQLPDLFIDLNNVLHLTWQSNRDFYWEIYYGNSDTNFTNTRITDYKCRSLRPKISGDTLGNLFIVWHDDRFGGWEIMLAYKTDSRILPWMQEDPYLAALRNGGYNHVADTAFPVTVTNSTTEPLCVSKIRVDFYENRLLENNQFYLDNQVYPFAFSSAAAQEDTSSQYIDLSAEGSVGEHVLAEYNSGLPLSEILSLSLLFTTAGTVQIAFRGSDIASDPQAASQWTDYADISSGSNTNYSTLGLPAVVGKYKQIKINVLGAVAAFTYCSVTSLAHERLCLAAGESAIVNVNLTPSVDDVPVALPLAFVNNQTYFVGVTIYDKNGVPLVMSDSHLTVSYAADSDPQVSWSETSCTFNFSVNNTSEDLTYYNFIVGFYQDPAYEHLIASYAAAYGQADLSRFTVDNTAAASVWTATGLPVLADNISKVMLTVPLEDVECDILYYVKVTTCETIYGSTPCTTYTDFLTNTWRCGCSSNRWTSAPAENLNTLSRWKSSSSGLADTRITDTRALNGVTTISNINPSIKLRDNLNGIILYQTNRNVQSPNVYGIYASVFNVIPAYDMYASGGQNITSQGYIIAKTDVPVSGNGVNASFDIDPFENIFAAWEQPVEGCTDLAKGKATTINVHRCGLAETDLVFNQQEPVVTPVSQCSQNILQTSFIGDREFENVVRVFRVKNESVVYHTTYENQPLSVVDHCSIKLEVIGTPESVAVRFRNSEDNWSVWQPFNPLIGDYTADFDWSLPSDSGLKKITMQVATPSGLTPSKSILVAADYKSVNYSVLFYSLPGEADFSDTDMSTVPLPNEALIFMPENELDMLNGYPVAGLRPPAVENNNLVFRTSDFIFVEIQPAPDYVTTVGLTGSEPSFDVLTQGAINQYNLKTYHTTNNDLDVYRGVFKITKEGLSQARDGFSRLILHFKNECSTVTTAATVVSYNRDTYNVLSTEQVNVISEADVWKEERDRLGLIGSKIQLRPNEDAYFAFGDPNYRTQHE